MCQVADMEMSALHHHGLYIYDCCRLPLGNVPPRMPVAAGLIYPIILVVPVCVRNCSQGYKETSQHNLKNSIK